MSVYDKDHLGWMEEQRLISEEHKARKKAANERADRRRAEELRELEAERIERRRQEERDGEDARMAAAVKIKVRTTARLETRLGIPPADYSVWIDPDGWKHVQFPANMELVYRDDNEAGEIDGVIKGYPDLWTGIKPGEAEVITL